MDGARVSPTTQLGPSLGEDWLAGYALCGPAVYRSLDCGPAAGGIVVTQPATQASAPAARTIDTGTARSTRVIRP